MLVCTCCKKNLNNAKPNDRIATNPTTLPGNGIQDYTLCEECYSKYYRALSELENKFILGINHQSKNKNILLESNSQNNINPDDCYHSWFYVSCDLYDVEGCMGIICKNCGTLSCACRTEDTIGSRTIGDELFKKFYPKSKSSPLKLFHNLT